MDNPNVDAKKGDILWAENNKNRSGRPPHYMIYIEPHTSNSDLFKGVMITHSTRFNNIPLEEVHFNVSDCDGNEFKVIYDQSLIVGNLLIKKVEWSPFKKVGQLSPEGIAFVERVISRDEAQDYYDNL